MGESKLLEERTRLRNASLSPIALEMPTVPPARQLLNLRDGLDVSLRNLMPGAPRSDVRGIVEQQHQAACVDEAKTGE
jgi:hypothetical protein